MKQISRIFYTVVVLLTAGGVWPVHAGDVLDPLTSEQKMDFFGVDDGHRQGSLCAQAIELDSAADVSSDDGDDAAKILAQATVFYCQELAIIYKIDIFSAEDNRKLCAPGEGQKRAQLLRIQIADLIAEHPRNFGTLHEANLYTNEADRLWSRICSHGHHE